MLVFGTTAQRSAQMETSMQYCGCEPRSEVCRSVPLTPQRDEGFLHGVVGQVIAAEDSSGNPMQSMEKFRFEIVRAGLGRGVRADRKSGHAVSIARESREMGRLLHTASVLGLPNMTATRSERATSAPETRRRTAGRSGTGQPPLRTRNGAALGDIQPRHQAGPFRRHRRRAGVLPDELASRTVIVVGDLGVAVEGRDV